MPRVIQSSLPPSSQTAKQVHSQGCTSRCCRCADQPPDPRGWMRCPATSLVFLIWPISFIRAPHPRPRTLMYSPFNLFRLPSSGLDPGYKTPRAQAPLRKRGADLFGLLHLLNLSHAVLEDLPNGSDGLDDDLDTWRGPSDTDTSTMFLPDLIWHRSSVCRSRVFLQMQKPQIPSRDPRWIE